VFLLLIAATASEAKPKFLVVFNTYYKPDPSSAVGKAECAICHDGPPKRNVYGKDLKKLLDASDNGELTADMLKQVESIDSDGDGWSNGDEIKQGFLPGDPSSHPNGKPAKPTAPAPPSGISIIPTNGFHPVVVHFPIALFLFGLFLEFAGHWRKSPALGTAAQWNITGALASLAIVVPTGVAAWLIGGHKLEGNMLIHLILAISSLILMLITLLARKKLGNDHAMYLAILVLTAIIVGLTGHFGGQMVYG
jgi:uncharacterized membrane protein